VTPAPPCWICGGGAAETREHRAKASDLRSLFGDFTQADPLYFHTAQRRNFRVGSLKADVLKFSHRICIQCNSTRTQPHDRAWAVLSETLRSRRPPIAPGAILRANGIFPYDTKRAMRNVHLYFVKAFGCQIVEGGIPIDIGQFSKAILDGRPHPNLYLALGPTPKAPGEPVIAGGSDVQVAMLGKQCAFATWFYEVGNLSVNVMYAIDGEKGQGLVQAWHPRSGRNRLVMANFRSEGPVTKN
jgi:hypothetical protein